MAYRYKGIFVVFEGPDGVGKSTQAKLFAEWAAKELQAEVVLTREPGGTELGKTLREIILNKEYKLSQAAEFLLFNADRAQHVSEVIVPALQRGAIVVCDRYLPSTFAYQCYGRGWSHKDVEVLHEIATNNLVPDHTFLLTGESRKESDISDRFETEGDRFKNAVAKYYDGLMQGEEGVVVIDSKGTIEQIHERICEEFLEILQVA